MILDGHYVPLNSREYIALTKAMEADDAFLDTDTRLAALTASAVPAPPPAAVDAHRPARDRGPLVVPAYEDDDTELHGELGVAALAAFLTRCEVCDE